MNNSDLILVRDRVLAKLKMGKQSTAGKAIDAFIKELHKTPTAPEEQKPSTWEARADNFLKEVAGNG